MGTDNTITYSKGRREASFHQSVRSSIRPVMVLMSAAGYEGNWQSSHLRHSVRKYMCAFIVSVPLSRPRALSLSALFRLWECALQQEWCDFRRNIFWAKFKMRFLIAIKISFYFRQKKSISTQPFFSEI